MISLSMIFAVFGILTLLVAALGLFRLPDALSRQHAATKAATIGVSLFATGLMLYALASDWGTGWLVRLAVLQVCLLGVLPLASHALARAGAIEARFNECDKDGNK